MKTFRGYRNSYTIVGDENDCYFRTLPDHDLGALSNYFLRLSKKRPMRNCLDIGANIGLSALILSEIEPKARIYAFEPSQRTFTSLIENISKSHFNATVTALQFALGKERGIVNFIEDDTMSAGNHISLDSTGVEVGVNTVDNIATELGLTSIDFIKIDVEGFEIDVIEGSLKSIFDFRPTFFFEYNEYALRHNSKKDPKLFLTRAMECLGPLGVVHPQSGGTIPLPLNGSEAYEKIKSMSKSEIDVFDLATEAS